MSVPCVLICSGCHNKIPEKFTYSWFWKPGDPRSKCWLIQFLVRALFLACQPSPWASLPAFSLGLHIVDREGQQAPIGALILSDQSPTLMVSSNLLPPKAPSLSTITTGVRVSTYGLWRHTDIQSLTRSI